MDEYYDEISHFISFGSLEVIDAYLGQKDYFINTIVDKEISRYYTEEYYNSNNYIHCKDLYQKVLLKLSGATDDDFFNLF